jgi:hypothetical protein
MSSGVSDSGRSAWVFDQIEVEAPCDDSPWGPVPVRLTALLDDEDGRRVRAAHWSIPLPSNAKQQELRAAGKLPDGAPFEESVPPEVGSLADRLRHALTGNAPVPELYSVRDEAITIGSVTDEIFPGPAGKVAWEKFIDLDPRLEVRGGIRGGSRPTAPPPGWQRTSTSSSRSSRRTGSSTSGCRRTATGRSSSRTTP